MKDILTLFGILGLLAAESALAVGLISTGLWLALGAGLLLYRQHKLGA